MIKWLQGTYNGLYKIVLEPFTPRRKMVLMLVVAMIVGLIIGYGIDPVQYYDGDPRTLGQSWQNEWVKLLADRYALDPTNPQANQNITELLTRVDNPLGIIDALIATPGEEGNVGKLQAIRPLAEAAQASAVTAPAQPGLLRSLLPWILGPLVGAIVIVVFSWAWHILIKNWLDPVFKRLRGERESVEVKQARERAAAQKQIEATQRTNFTQTDLGPPLMQRMTNFQLGYGEYDDSFSIEDEQERFLGECGSSISETIGAGDPKKPTAIEVWLFDKDDFVRTITKVFMTEYAYNDPAIRANLETKGDLVLAKPGAVVMLETASLRLQARVIEVEYGTGPTPPNSFFNKLTIELAAWRKTGASAGAPVPAPSIPAPLPVSTPAYQPPAAPAYQPPPAPAYQPPAAPAYQPPPANPAPAYVPPPAPQPYQPPPNPVPPPPASVPGMQPGTPMRPAAPPPRPPDDDPFGGTGDFTPIS